MCKCGGSGGVRCKTDDLPHCVDVKTGVKATAQEEKAKCSVSVIDVILLFGLIISILNIILIY